MPTVQDQNTRRPYHDEHLYVDLREEVVILHGETVWLTPLQYRLLAVLVETPGRFAESVRRYRIEDQLD